MNKHQVSNIDTYVYLDINVNQLMNFLGLLKLTIGQNLKVSPD